MLDSAAEVVVVRLRMEIRDRRSPSSPTPPVEVMLSAIRGIMILCCERGSLSSLNEEYSGHSGEVLSSRAREREERGARFSYLLPLVFNQVKKTQR